MIAASATRVERSHRGCVGDSVDVGGQLIRQHGVDAAELHEMTSDLHTELREELATDCSRGNARRRLAGGCALEHVASIVAIVLEHAGEIGVAGARARHYPLARSDLA